MALVDERHRQRPVVRLKHAAMLATEKVEHAA
jgi:hypothetical protein